MRSHPALKPGDAAPPVRFQAAHGEEVALTDFRGTSLLLVFLRHLG
jgi:peroxiredoxin